MILYCNVLYCLYCIRVYGAPLCVRSHFSFFTRHIFTYGLMRVFKRKITGWRVNSTKQEPVKKNKCKKHPHKLPDRIMLLGNPKASLFLLCTLSVLSSTAASENEGSVLRGKDFTRRLTSQQVQFVNKCSEELLSSNVLSDKIITQKEFTQTYLSLCSQFGIEGCDQDASFETLDEDVQFAFASEMCHTKSSTCLQSLITIGTVMHEVGYIVSSEGVVVENLVNNICYELEYAVYGKFPFRKVNDKMGVSQYCFIPHRYPFGRSRTCGH